MLKDVATRWPAVTLTGPRQSGKTTLTKSVFPNHTYVNLDESVDRDFAQSDPRKFLSQYSHDVILDEIQKAPTLMPYIKRMIDEDRTPGRWILTGSQSTTLFHNKDQPLLGRTAIRNLLPLTYREILRFPKHPISLQDILWSGSYPTIYQEKLPFPQEWFEGILSHIIKQDIPLREIQCDDFTIKRFLKLLAFQSGQLLNFASLASDCGITQSTAKKLISILDASFIIFLLDGMHTHPRQKYAKMPKLHFYDTGLLCWLLKISKPESLYRHYLREEIFQTWVVSEIIKERSYRGIGMDNLYYYHQEIPRVELALVIKTVIKTSNNTHLTLIDSHYNYTPQSRFFRPLDAAEKQLSQDHNTLSIIFYAGYYQAFRDMALFPFTHISQIPWQSMETYELPKMGDMHSSSNAQNVS